MLYSGFPSPHLKGRLLDKEDLRALSVAIHPSTFKNHIVIAITTTKAINARGTDYISHRMVESEEQKLPHLSEFLSRDDHKT